MYDYTEEEEALAQSRKEIGNTGNVKNSRVPKPPKKGELMYCQYCGNAMMPEHFSKNPLVRKREFKWQIHQACQMLMESLCDRKTSGLTAERGQREKKNETQNKY